MLTHLAVPSPLSIASSLANHLLCGTVQKVSKGQDKLNLSAPSQRKISYLIQDGYLIKLDTSMSLCKSCFRICSQTLYIIDIIVSSLYLLGSFFAAFKWKFYIANRQSHCYCPILHRVIKHPCCLTGNFVCQFFSTLGQGLPNSLLLTLVSAH